MADFSQNITNSVRVFGGEPATKWGDAVGTPYTMVWGTTLWGEGSYTTIFSMGKIISESLALGDVYAKGSNKKISESLLPGSDMYIERLSDGSGWQYVFTSDTTNAEERDFATYTSSSVYDATFTCAAANSTSWTAG